MLGTNLIGRLVGGSFDVSRPQLHLHASICLDTASLFIVVHDRSTFHRSGSCVLLVVRSVCAACW
jgi:hypothetical protein